jgi:hypothetical protein
MLKRLSRTLLPGLAIGLALATVGAAIAAMNTPTDVIAACVDHTGNLRMLVGTTDHCRPAETPVQWNITGPPGAGFLKAVDANSLTIGALYPNPEAHRVDNWSPGVPTTIVVIKADDIFVGVEIEKAGFNLYSQGTMDQLYWYDDSTCTGTKYLQSPSMLSKGFVTTDYVLHYDGPPYQSRAGGYRNVCHPMSPCTCTAFAEPGIYGVAAEYQLPAFTPPFRATQ